MIPKFLVLAAISATAIAIAGRQFSVSRRRRLRVIQRPPLSEEEFLALFSPGMKESGIIILRCRQALEEMCGLPQGSIYPDDVVQPDLMSIGGLEFDSVGIALALDEVIAEERSPPVDAACEFRSKESVRDLFTRIALAAIPPSSGTHE